MFEIDKNHRIDIEEVQKEELDTPLSIDTRNEPTENLPAIIADSPFCATKENRMTSAFIKLNRSDKVLKLIEEYPPAFILLTIIALRAERKDCQVTGLKKGQAKIKYTDMESHRSYRTSCEKLILYGFATIKTTNRFTIATLIDSTIYDINLEDADKLNDKQPTNKRQTEKPTRISTKKKELKNNTVADAFEKFGDFVELTKEQHQKLEEKHGTSKLARMLEILDNYIGSKGGRTGIRHTSDYYVLKNGGWVDEKWKQEQLQPVPKIKISPAEDNAAWAKQFDRDEGGWSIQASEDSWRANSWTDQTKSISIWYKTSGFKAQVESFLRKHNLWLK